MQAPQFATFHPHPLLRNGHLQTIIGAFRYPKVQPLHTVERRVLLADGDQLVLHDNQPSKWRDGDPVAVLVHGLCGSHEASYIVRLTLELNGLGIRTFRVDMRGCGAARDHCREITHAGRSEDTYAATLLVSQLAAHSPIFLVGISLGGNQLLKMLGELAADPQQQHLLQRIQRAVVVSPPVDLAACSDNMRRPHLRPYSNHFIRGLLRRTPAILRQHPIWGQLKLHPRPKTMRDFDQRITAPLGGFASADDYYSRSSSWPWLPKIVTPVLVVAAEDDPIVPPSVIRNAQWSDTTTIEFTRSGGHLGFVGTAKSAGWLEQRISSWLTALSNLPTNVRTELREAC